MPPMCECGFERTCFDSNWRACRECWDLTLWDMEMYADIPLWRRGRTLLLKNYERRQRGE